jgi:hypothetical protein
MSPLAGIFGPNAEHNALRLTHALAQHRGWILTDGPLHVACERPPRPRCEPLCLIDGAIDDAQALAGELDVDAASPAESLLAIGYRRWGRGLLKRLRGITPASGA